MVSSTKASDRASVSCSTERLASTKDSGKQTQEMAAAWNDTRTETDMKESSLMASRTERASTPGPMAKCTKENGV